MAVIEASRVGDSGPPKLGWRSGLMLGWRSSPRWVRWLLTWVGAIAVTGGIVAGVALAHLGTLNAEVQKATQGATRQLNVQPGLIPFCNGYVYGTNPPKPCGAVFCTALAAYPHNIASRSNLFPQLAVSFSPPAVQLKNVALWKQWDAKKITTAQLFNTLKEEQECK